MIKVTVGGATGKLGSMVCSMILESDDMELVGAVVSATGGNVGRELFPGIVASGPDSLPGLLERTDVYVDLTTPEAASKVIPHVAVHGTNLVLGTTAVDPDALDAMAVSVVDHGTSALVSANFAPGVNVFWKVCEILSKALPDYDIEIMELHHGAKKDAPSGTTLEAVSRMSGSSPGRDKVIYGREGMVGARGREICIHSARAGDAVGDHIVLMAGNKEIIELKHRAVSREAFALGCMESIRWIAPLSDGRVHGMGEVLGI